MLCITDCDITITAIICKRLTCTLLDQQLIFSESQEFAWVSVHCRYVIRAFVERKRSELRYKLLHQIHNKESNGKPLCGDLEFLYA